MSKLKTSQIREMIREMILSEIDPVMPQNTMQKATPINNTPVPVDPELLKAQKDMAALDKDIQDLNSRKAPYEKKIAEKNIAKEALQKKIDGINAKNKQK